jgi:hypothetical protein
MLLKYPMMQEFEYMYSTNGVPYPLDSYLYSIGEPTTDEIASLIQSDEYIRKCND